MKKALEAFRQEVVAAMSNDLILKSGWDGMVTWRLLDPGRQPVDKLVPMFDKLHHTQQEAILSLAQEPDWGDLTPWQQEAYRVGFERQIGYIMRLVEAKFAQIAEQEEEESQ